MKRIAVAGFLHETNTFSPIPTEIKDFAEGGISSPGILYGKDIFYFKSGEMNNATSGFLRKADIFNLSCIPIAWMEAEPSAAMSQETFNQLLQDILGPLKNQGPFDGVFLDLHGAMVVEGGLDGETEILRLVREVVGNIPIVAALDLHGNISLDCFELASALVGYQTYPHVDIYETGERCAEILEELVCGKKVYKAFEALPFIMPTSSQVTHHQPLQAIFEKMQDFEKDENVFSASIMLGFPPGDIECNGPTVITYARSQELADSVLADLSSELLSHESEFVSKLSGIDEGIDQAVEQVVKGNKPIVLADVQDNPGGGSGSDSVWILEALLDRGIQNAAIGLMYDPESAARAHKAGEGNMVQLDLGGKMMPGHVPLSAEYEVIRCFEGEIEGTGPMARGMRFNLGKMALLKIKGIYISVGSIRIQAADQAVFTALGLNPADMDILVLKSFVHFRAAFEEIAAEIIEIEAPGAEFDDPVKVKYQNLRDGMRLCGNGPVFYKELGKFL